MKEKVCSCGVTFIPKKKFHKLCNDCVRDIDFSSKSKRDTFESVGDWDYDYIDLEEPH